MNIEKFTAASRQILSNAQLLAAKHNHQQLMPVHFLAALLDEETGIIVNLINSIGADINNISTKVADELSRIPSVEVRGGGQVSMSSEGLKILEKSISLAKD